MASFDHDYAWRKSFHDHDPARRQRPVHYRFVRARIHRTEDDAAGNGAAVDDDVAADLGGDRGTEEGEARDERQYLHSVSIWVTHTTSAFRC
jgi:hypothetical protein